MQHSHHSPIHRSRKMLCSNFSGGSQIVNHAFEYLPDPQHQHLHTTSVGERNSFLNPTSMTPVPGTVMDFQVSHPMDSVNVGMRSTQPSMYPLQQPQFIDPCFVADSRLAANIDVPFYIPQFFDNPAHLGGMLYDPLAAPQPPTPPAAPEASILPNPGFQYHHCLWLGGPQCDGFAPGKNREMAEHLRVYHHFVGHERDPVCCEWQNCGQIMQRMNVARHIVSRHLLAAATCRFCGRRFCRPDVVTRHERTCGVVPSD